MRTGEAGGWYSPPNTCNDCDGYGCPACEPPAVSKRGGARPGAGRKAGTDPRRTHVTLTLAASEAATLEALASDQGTTPGRLATRLVVAALEQRSKTCGITSTT